jgi:hypothetical protein
VYSAGCVSALCVSTLDAAALVALSLSNHTSLYTSHVGTTDWRAKLETAKLRWASYRSEWNSAGRLFEMLNEWAERVGWLAACGFTASHKK